MDRGDIITVGEKPEMLFKYMNRTTGEKMSVKVPSGKYRVGGWGNEGGVTIYAVDDYRAYVVPENELREHERNMVV